MDVAQFKIKYNECAVIIQDITAKKAEIRLLKQSIPLKPIILDNEEDYESYTDANNTYVSTLSTLNSELQILIDSLRSKEKEAVAFLPKGYWCLIEGLEDWANITPAIENQYVGYSKAGLKSNINPEHLQSDPVYYFNEILWIKAGDAPNQEFPNI